jgi:hypothetical protein
VPLSDDDLLAFDHKRLGGLNYRSPRSLLEEHGDVYRHHLVAARWLDAYSERVKTMQPAVPASETQPEMPHPEFRRGVVDTLRDIATHLRQGDFLPGGSIYESEMEGDPGPRG